MKTTIQAVAAAAVIALLAVAGMYAMATQTNWFDKPVAVQVATDATTSAPSIDIGQPLAPQNIPVHVIDLGQRDDTRDVSSLPVVAVCPHLDLTGAAVVGVAHESEKPLPLSCITVHPETPLAPAPMDVAPELPEAPEAPPEAPPAPPMEEAPEAPPAPPMEEAPAPPA